MLTKQKNIVPITALLIGAAIWGIAWYPYRLLEQSGIRGEASTTLTYFVALLMGLMLFHKQIRAPNFLDKAAYLLVWIGVCSGLANIAYILGIIHGEVMRVLLLFYLAPLWTILFARALLNEKLSLRGYWVILLSILGAMTMLWQRGNVFPFPVSYGDWMGLLGGIMFALANVLARKDQQHNVQLKSLAIWLGVTLTGFFATWRMESLPLISNISTDTWLLLLGLGFTIFFLSIILQYGLTHIPANQAIVIMLFELIVAAIASYFLTNEVMTPKEWIGGLMIVSASLFSAKINHEDSMSQQS
ncbi:DMT family transporter [Nitrosomonas sp. Nm132]|uniref:DMT family transporter n=1 Tax=Nitrosomonas sp. Nm132 TaxID=1881053 RepID=UPI00087EF653|nr:DMT family transporter [Nitrosomonas sp. Nm132]SDH85937.1 Permease of the drug/metabolite transporter (DMT) superfamily [Nitrosomonas sp. Nm132]